MDRPPPPHHHHHHLLRQPSNPPPTGPLPRPPSFLENQLIAARLSATSPPPPSLPPPTSHLALSNSPLPVARQLSAHTQASSDALGENNRPSVQDEITSLPAPHHHHHHHSSHTSFQSTRESRYSGSSFNPPSSSAFPPPPVIAEDSQHSSRCVSRLSRLSYISGGAAFVVSQDPDPSNTPQTATPSYTVEHILGDYQDIHPLTPSPRDTPDLPDLHPFASTLRSTKDPTLRIHPADNRFEHTYRIRRASEAEEPIFVPVYSFEPSGKFPNRTRPTPPLASPRFVNHTPRNFSLPGRADARHPAPRSSADSAERLLADSPIPVPPRTYAGRPRPTRVLDISLSRKSQVTLSNLSGRDRSSKAAAAAEQQHCGKETARQRFEREHSHYFHDLDHLEQSNWPDVSVPPQVQIHGPRYSFSKYGVPILGRPHDAYTGDDINQGHWPDRYKRQKRIGRSLLCICVLMPPLWLIMAVGLLDNLVVEMTGGDIWGVGRSEKKIAAWLGGTFCFALIVTIAVVGIVVL